MKKRDDRLQQLREWQKKRNEAKAIAQAKKKPIFSVGKQPSFVFNAKSVSSKESAAKKSIMSLSPSKKSVRPLVVPISNHNAPVRPVASVPPSKQPSSQPLSSRNIGEDTKTKISEKLTSSTGTSLRQSKSTASSTGTSLRQSKPTVSSTGAPLRQVKTTAVSTGAPLRQSARLAKNKSSVSVPKKSVAPPSVDITNSKNMKKYKSTKNVSANIIAPANQKVVVKSVAPAKGKPQKPVRCATPGGNRNRRTQKPNKYAPQSEPTVEPDGNMESETSLSAPPLEVSEKKEEPLVISIPPTTPIKKNYDPICPSPLLCSHSAHRDQHPYNFPLTFVDEPAWIPGANITTDITEVNFKNKFSPFTFGSSDATSAPFQFSFAKKEEPLPEQLQEFHLVVTDSGDSKESTTTASDKVARMSIAEDDASMDNVAALAHGEQGGGAGVTRDHAAGKKEDTPSELNSNRTNSRSSASRRRSRVQEEGGGVAEKVASVVLNLANVLEDESEEECGKFNVYQ